MYTLQQNTSRIHPNQKKTKKSKSMSFKSCYTFLCKDSANKIHWKWRQSTAPSDWLVISVIPIANQICVISKVYYD